MKALPSLLAGLLVVLAAPFLGASAAHAGTTDHYVDCAATASGDGSAATPWNNLASVNAHTFTGGDRLLFARGVTCSGRLDPRGSGTAASPIVVDAYGSGTARPVIAGGGTVDAGIHLYNVQGWEINTLEVTNTAATRATRSGILVEIADIGTGSHYVLDNVYVHDVTGDDTKASNGIQFEVTGTTTPTHFDDVTVENSEIYKVDREGLTTGSSWNCRSSYGSGCTSSQTWTANTHVVLRNNLIHSIGGDGLVMRVADGAQVTGNTAYDIWTDSAGNNAGIWTIDSDNTVIAHNEVYNVHQRIGDGDGEAFDSDYGNQGTLIEYNYSHDNAGGFTLLCGTCGGGSSSTGTIVRYNLSRDDGDRIIFAAGEKAAQIYGNTVYLPTGSTTRILEDNSATTYATWSDNIIDNRGTGGYTYTAAHYTWQDNLLYGYHPANEPADTGKLTADPEFADATATVPTGFELAAGSPARGSGAAVAGNGALDYFGTAVPQVCAPDRGFAQASSFNDAGCAAVNLVRNPGFETGALSPWTAYRTAAAETAHPHAGTHDLAVAAGSSAEQVVTVQPGTSYTLSGWAEVSAAGTEVVIGTKNYGGTETRAPAFTGTTYSRGSVTFTTGATSTTATIYCFNHLGTGSGYCDDLSLTANS